MTSKFPDLVTLVFLLALLAVIFLKRRSRKSQLPLPPGPRKLPLVGNLFDFPSSFEWEAFQTWGKEYNSDILHLDAAVQSLVVLNSVEAARNLLEKRSAIYSSRPRFPVINDFMKFSWLMPFIPYGREWKEQRRLLQRHMHPSNSDIHKVKEVHSVGRLLFQILEDPENYVQHVNHSVGGTLHSIAYGGETKALDSRFLKDAEEVAEHLGDSSLIATLIVEIVPFLLRFPYLLSFLPSAAFTKNRREWKDLGFRLRDGPFSYVQNLMRDNVADPSLVKNALEAVKSESQHDQNALIRDVAAVIYIGGYATISAVLHTFFLAMTCFPDAQVKAQEELDRVVGRSRLVEFEDEPQLPYLAALLKEIHRWRPAGPVAIPHFLEQEDEYNGYRIPANSTVLPNIWAMLHDENTYHEPDTFRPERFLKNGYLDPNVLDPENVVFGFGRRICPGAHVAHSYIFIVAASILSGFKISPAINDQGRPIQPTMEYCRPSLTLQPVPFKCRIEPRHYGVKALILARTEQI